MSSRTCLLLFALALIGLGRDARADSDTHYADHVVGERAAGMGGAFTALADEATGAYYNPAGIIAEESLLLQLSMSAFKWRRRAAEMGDVCGTGFRAEDSAFFSFPGSFGFVKQLRSGRVAHALGLTLVVPHSEKMTQSFLAQSARCGPYSYGIGGSSFRVDRVFWAGLSYAIRPWRFLQLGLNLGVAIRTGTMTSFVTSVPDDGGLTSYYPALDFRDGEATIWNFFVQLGVIVRPTEKLRLGLSVTPPQIRLGGSGRVAVIAAGSEPASWQQTQALVLEDASYHWRVPFAIAFGAAYRFAGRLTLAADLKIHGREERHAVLEQAAVGTLFSSARAIVVNPSVGGELQVHPRVSLRLGFFTNLSSLPEDLLGEGLERVNLFGLSLGGTLVTSQASALSFAVQGQLGTGQVAAPRLSFDGTAVRRDAYLTETSNHSVVVSVGGHFDIR